MVAVNSTMLPLGSAAPDFELADTTSSGGAVSKGDFAGQAMLVMFICNHCPYVLRVMPELAELANKARQQGFAVVAISSNDIENYPQDGPQAMRVFAEENRFEFPYLYDESQAVAKAYRAACTPDFYVFDRAHTLQYRGQMDGARPSNDLPADGQDLQAALDAVAAQRPVSTEQIPSIGCNIKWKAGNAPDYF